MWNSFKDNLLIVSNRVNQLPGWLRVSIWSLVVIIFVFYYPIGMIVVHNIDDDPKFEAGSIAVPKGSATISIVSALIDREVNRHHWTPSDPFFMPGAALDRMPAFQRGIIQALARYSVSLMDQLGRVRGASQVDKDLQQANSLLNYSPDVWIFDFSVSYLPTASSVKQYRAAMKALQNYNIRLSKGQAVFDTRADNLQETLDRIAMDLGAASAAIDDHIEDYSGNMIDTNADVLYYEVKGKLYAYMLIMREMRKDFNDVIVERRLEKSWQQAQTSLQEGAELDNFFIFNAPTDSQFLPNHLASLGFYLIRARTQLREITAILQK